MKRIFLIVLALTSTLAKAQNSSKAKTLLDKVYYKVKTYDNIFVNFKYVLNNEEANISQETRGDVTLQGEKYVFNYLGVKQLYDGKKVYIIVPENEEVTIESTPENDDPMTPSKMLTFYRQGHNYKWDILQNINGRKIQYIKLVPIDEYSEIVSILLGIDVETKHIYRLIETRKNGNKTTITVNSFKTNQLLPKTLFTFDKGKYKSKGYYIIEN